MSQTRLNQLIQTDNFCPRINEVKLIALAINVPPAELFEYICKDVRPAASGHESPFD